MATDSMRERAVPWGEEGAYAHGNTKERLAEQALLRVALRGGNEIPAAVMEEAVEALAADLKHKKASVRHGAIRLLALLRKEHVRALSLAAGVGQKRGAGITVNIFERAAAITEEFRRLAGAGDGRVIEAGPVRGDGGGEPVDQAHAAPEAGGVPDGG